MTDDEASILLSLAVGLMDLVHYHECKVKRKSARALSVGNLIDNSLRVLDLYRVRSWDGNKLDLADSILNETEELVGRWIGARADWHSGWE